MTDEQRPDRDMEWPSEDLVQPGATPKPREDAEWPTEDHRADAPGQPSTPQPAPPPLEATPPTQPAPQRPEAPPLPEAAPPVPPAAVPPGQPDAVPPPPLEPAWPEEPRQPTAPQRVPEPAAPQDAPPLVQSAEPESPPPASPTEPAWPDPDTATPEPVRPPPPQSEQAAALPSEETPPSSYEQAALASLAQAQAPQAHGSEYDETRPPPQPQHGAFTGPAPSLTPPDQGPYAVAAGAVSRRDTAGPDDPARAKRDGYFRPDIEGLRAVAVIAVLLFHIGLPLTTGGFIGVDVFYVISGFLITGLLLRESEGTGKIDLLAFYARRMRRLLPAALVVIVVTLALSAVIVTPLRLTEIAGDAAAAALYVANFRFAIEATNYLASEAQSPLLHYWTLGVEEQFYLVWPLILLVATRFLSLRLMGLFFVALAVASFALSLYWTEASPAWAFFSPMTRAWELAAGALIAVGLLRIPNRAPRWTASILVVVGLGLIVAAVFLLSDLTPFPGVAALLPVLGAVLVIIGGVARPTIPGRVLLANPVSRYIGRISYSLYLWHWPILILIPIAIGSNDLVLRVGLAGVAVLVAAVSTEVIEQPFRRSGFLNRRSLGSVQLGLAGSVAVGVAAVLMTGTITIPAPWIQPDPVVVELAGVRDDLPRAYADGCHLEFDETELADCVYGDLEGSQTAVLFGDSHAAQWLPALDEYSQQQGWRLEFHTKAACSPAPATLWERKLRRVYDECHAWRKAVKKRIGKTDPAVVFVGSSRDYELWDNGRAWQTREVYPYWQSQLTALVEDLGGRAERVVLLAETPYLNFDPIDCLADKSVSNCDPPTRLVVDQDYAALEAAAADAGGASILTINDLLCPGRACPVVVQDSVVFRDKHHLTASYMAQLSQPIGNLLEGRAPYPTPVPSTGPAAPPAG